MDPVSGIVFLIGTAAVLAVVVVLTRRRPLDAVEAERRRIQAILRSGRMADAHITEYHDGILFFSYSVRGVEYTASQDVRQFASQLPADPAALAGPVIAKYAIHNPADSIVLSQEWSGLGLRHQSHFHENGTDKGTETK